MESLQENWEKFANSKRFICISKVKDFVGKAAQNLIGIVTGFKEPVKSKGGDGDWTMNITISDPSCPPPARGFMILIFKARKEECPVLAIGDVVKCSVKCQAFQGRAQGTITKFNPKGKFYVQILIQGDPSLTLEDAIIFSDLKRWWNSLVSNASSKQLVDRLVNAASTITKKRPELNFSDLTTDGAERVYFDTFCKVIKNIVEKEESETQTLVVTDFTASIDESSQDYPMCLEAGDIEELPNIAPEYMIVLTLWDNHAKAFDIPVGSYLCLQNVQSKKDSTGRFEYAIHGDPVYPKKRLVHFRNTFDPDLKPLLSRELQFSQGSSQPTSSSMAQIPPNNCVPEVNSKMPRKHELHLNEIFGDEYFDFDSIDESIAHAAKKQATAEVNVFSQSTDTAQLKPPSASTKEHLFVSVAGAATESHPPASFSSVEKANSARKPPLNPCLVLPDLPVRTKIAVLEKDSISKNPTEQHSYATISHILEMPTPRKYKLMAKVVDYMPFSVDHFVQALCRECGDAFVQLEPDSKCDCKSMEIPTRYIYFFYLLLNDGSSYLPVLVTGDVAERIIGYPPTPHFLGNLSSGAVIKQSMARLFSFRENGSNHPTVLENGEQIEFSLVSYSNPMCNGVLVQLVDAGRMCLGNEF